MSRSDNIFLIGPMGCGKTTIGRGLALRLDKAFYDSDQVIEERTGVRVSLIFEIEGEAGFRGREKKVIEELTGQDSIVLASGGGAILDPINRERLRSCGQVVYLHAPIELLYERTRRDRNRPLLQTPDPRETLKQLVEQRDALYRETAHLIIDTDHRTVADVVAQIQRRCSPEGAQSHSP